MVETFSSSWGMRGLEEGRIPGEPRKELIETGTERSPSLSVDLLPWTQKNRYFSGLGVDQSSKQPVSLSSSTWYLF